jgi:ADP-ribose pyrophosphatase
LNWESVIHLDSVLAVPLDRDGNVYLIRQYRAQLGRETLEAIGGGVEPGVAPAEAMQHELREEAGIEATLIFLGQGELGAATTRCHQHLYLAAVERVSEHEREPFERLTVRGIERMPLEQAVELARYGRILDVSSRLAILLAAEYLRQHGQLVDAGRV